MFEQLSRPGSIYSLEATNGGLTGFGGVVLIALHAAGRP